MNTVLSRVLAVQYRLELIACLAVIPFASGCSAAGSATPTEHASVAPSSPRPSGPMLTGTVTTAEDVTLTASFRVPIHVLENQEPTPAPRAVGCMQYAAGEQGSFVVPVFDVTSGDHSIYLAGMMSSGYHGPGAYDSSTEPSLGGTISVGVGVDVGQQPAYSIFRSHINGTSTLTVHDDGSGTFLFSEWGSDEVRGDTGSAAGISGSVTWTCR
jgi:hypothetical protein